jgi:Ca-activated chloride channel family protein
VRQEGRRDNNLQVLVREKNKSTLIHTQGSNETVRYLTGHYDIETLTLPRRVFNVEIQPNKTQSVLLPAPGIVNFNTISTGYGSLYEIHDDGTQTWVCNLNELKNQFALSLLPGQYKIVFRVKQTSGSKYTAFKRFAVKSGVTLIVNVFN